MIRRYISERLGFAVSDRVSRFDAANCAILVDYPLIIELNTAINRATFLIGLAFWKLEPLRYFKIMIEVIIFNV